MNAKKTPVQLPNELIAQIITIRINDDLLDLTEPSAPTKTGLPGLAQLKYEAIDDDPDCNHCHDLHPTFCAAILAALPEFRPTVTAAVHQHCVHLVDFGNTQYSNSPNWEWSSESGGEWVHRPGELSAECWGIWTEMRCGERSCRWRLEVLMRCLETP